MTKNRENKDTRTRNWTFVVYPESAPDNWREILDEHHVPWVESPLHDKDTDPNGEIKKPHWHVLMMFSSNKSYEQIREITTQLRTPNPQKAANAKGLVRYFAHIDNPEKYQYDKTGIIGHSGADVEAYLMATITEKREAIREIKRIIHEKKIVEYIDLLDILEDTSLDLFDLACNNTMLFNAIVRSNRHKGGSPDNDRKD